MVAGSKSTSKPFTVKPQFLPSETASIPKGRRLVLFACFVVMAFTATNQDLWVWFVGASTLAVGLVLLAWTREQPSAREVLLLALLFRLVLFPLLPSLSDDGYRYVWDGMLQVEGLNPYLYLPSDPSLGVVRNLDVFQRLNSTDYFTVYPPLSQVIFFVGSWLSGNEWQWSFLIIKAITLAIEFEGVFLLSTLVAPNRLVLYAWNPLVVMEVAGQGHGEGIVAAFLIATVWAIRRERPRLAAAAITGAVWVKLFPVVFVPFVMRRIGWRFVWIPTVLTAILVAPYAAPQVLGNVASSLDLYVRLFEFNAGPYLLLKSLGYATIGTIGLERVLGPLLALAFLGIVARLYWRDLRSDMSMSSVMSVVLGAFIVLATTVHPWYLVPILAMTPLMGFGAGTWLWLGATSSATYLYYSDGVYWPFVWLGWLGVAIMGAWYWLPQWSVLNGLLDNGLKKRAEEKARRIRPFLPELARTCEVLDLGAGEGYVGQTLKETVGFYDPRSGFEIPGCDVTLCDIRDANRTDLPFALYHGGRLPFAEDAFDATLLVFVLHHTESPNRVIREARRVTRKRVIIIETVYERYLERVILQLCDRFVNRIRSRGDMAGQEKWLRLRTVDEWMTMIERDGGVIQSVRRWGKFHKQVLFVIDAEVSGPRKEFMVQSVGRGF